jgi:hypothetical protein
MTKCRVNSAPFPLHRARTFGRLKTGLSRWEGEAPTSNATYICDTQTEPGNPHFTKALLHFASGDTSFWYCAFVRLFICTCLLSSYAARRLLSLGSAISCFTRCSKFAKTTPLPSYNLCNLRNLRTDMHNYVQSF